MDLLQNISRSSELSAHLLHLPAADRGSLAGLTSVSDIQAWTKVKADEYRQLALSLLAIHNIAAPIHRLPTEVLVQILERCWVDRKSFFLPHVCRLWRSILLDRAAFWADAVADCQFHGKRRTLNDDSELPFIDALLARSTQHSCTIKPTFFGFTKPIVKSLTPYKNSVASLHVTVGEDDLKVGLWPLLLSGMPSLKDLAIQIMITKGMQGHYSNDRSLTWLFDYDDYGLPWMGFKRLSQEELPRLSSLACPPNMLILFDDVVLRHLKMEWWDESLCLLEFPSTDLETFGPNGMGLEPYRDSLETLDIGPWCLSFSELSSTVEFSSLRYLHLRPSTSDWRISSYFSWLRFSQTTRIHITIPADWLPQGFHDSLPTDSTILRSVVSAIDRVCIQHSPHVRVPRGYHVRCFAGDLERLRMDDCEVTAAGLLAVFGSENARVTHLTVSLELGGPAMDLRAFPHLEHLTADYEDLDTVSSMLQRKGQAGPPELLCAALTELVVTFGLIVAPTYAPAGEQAASSRPGPIAGANVDEVFRQKCSAFQGVLARRASSASRLASLILSVRPASRQLVVQTTGSGSMMVDETAQSDATMDEGTVEVNSMVWPSHAVRQSVLQTLCELVDGPVVLKLVDRTGTEITVEEV